MPFRFRRSIRFVPGAQLNIGKKGLSATIGVRGAHVTVGHGQTRTTVGVPRTGVSYTTTKATPPPVPEITRRDRREQAVGRVAGIGEGTAGGVRAASAPA